MLFTCETMLRTRDADPQLLAYKEENDSTANPRRSIEGGVLGGRLIDRELIKRRRRNDARSPRSIRPVSRTGVQFSATGKKEKLSVIRRNREPSLKTSEINTGTSE